MSTTRTISAFAGSLYQPNENFNFRLVADWNHQETLCCGIGIVRVGLTLKPAAQQFSALAAQAGYTLPTSGPFDRKIDLNSPLQAEPNPWRHLRHRQLGSRSRDAHLGDGVANLELGSISMTATTRSLSIQTISSNFDSQDQYSQELRVASNGNTVDYVGGLYYYQQIIDGEPLSGWETADATRWLLT